MTWREVGGQTNGTTFFLGDVWVKISGSWERAGGTTSGPNTSPMWIKKQGTWRRIDVRGILPTLIGLWVKKA